MRDGRVCTLEPVARFADLCRQRNAGHPGIAVVTAAVGAASRRDVSDCRGPLSSLNADVPRSTGICAGSQENRPARKWPVVPVVTLDQVLREHHIPPALRRAGRRREGHEEDVFGRVRSRAVAARAMMIVELADTHGELTAMRGQHAHLAQRILQDGYTIVYKGRRQTPSSSPGNCGRGVPAATAGIAMITARPFGGLCNRLGSSIARCNSGVRSARDVEVIWALTPDMGPRSTSCVEPVPGLRFRPAGRFRFVRSPWTAPPLARAAIRAINRLLGVSYAFFEPDVERLLWTGQFDLSRLTAGDGVFLFTCQSVTHWKTLDYSVGASRGSAARPHRRSHGALRRPHGRRAHPADRSCDLRFARARSRAFVTADRTSDARRRPPVSLWPPTIRQPRRRSWPASAGT